MSIDGIKKSQAKASQVVDLRPAQPAPDQAPSPPKRARRKRRPQDLGIFFASNIFTPIRKHPVWSVSYLFLGSALVVTLFIIFQPVQALEPVKEIPEIYTEPLVVSLGEDTLSLQPTSGNRVRVEQNDNQYIYREAYKYTDVIQTNYHHKIKEEMIFHRSGHPIEFRYNLGFIENFHVEKDEQGNIIFYNLERYLEKGAIDPLDRIFTIFTPFVQDKQSRSFEDVEAYIENDVLIISINPDWLSQASYPVTLDPTIEINVLNVQSHPQQGDDWEVDFTTKGEADLYIIPDDQATIDDDEFTGLYCDSEVRVPEILEGDVIYYPDWQCDGVGKVVHYTLKRGDHMLKFDFGGQIAYAFNDGSLANGVAFLHGTETTAPSASTDINQATAYAVEWSSSDYDDYYFTHDSGGANPERVTIETAGDYLLAYTIPMESTEARSTVRAEIYVNGIAATSTIGESSYIRNQNGSNTQSSDHVAVLLTDLQVDDYIEVFVQATAAFSGATPVTITDQASLYLEHVADSPTRTIFAALATTTGSGTNFNQTATLEWNSYRKDTGITHTDGSTDITLTDAGTYLVFFNMPVNNVSETNNVRTNVRFEVKDDGTRVAGGVAAQNFLRLYNTLHHDASAHFSGAIYNVGAGSVITVTTFQEADVGTVTVQSGKYGSIYIEKLDTSSDIFFARATQVDNGTPDDWNPDAKAAIVWANDDVIDTDTYTHTAGTTNIVIDVAGDYLLIYNDALTGSGARENPVISVEVNGLTTGSSLGAQTKSHYIRDSDGHRESSGSLVFLLRNLQINDEVTVSTIVDVSTVAVSDLDEALLMLWRKPDLVVPNNDPTITSITDTPDPVSLGSSVTFDFDWNDDDAGDFIKAKLCSSNSLTNQNCDGTTYASSSVFTTDDVETLFYLTQEGDEPTLSWWGFVCDDDAACSAGTSGDTTISTIVPSGVKLKSGTIKLKSGIWKINLDDIGNVLFAGLLIPFGVRLRKRKIRR